VQRIVGIAGQTSATTEQSIDFYPTASAVIYDVMTY